MQWKTTMDLIWETTTKVFWRFVDLKINTACFIQGPRLATAKWDSNTKKGWSFLTAMDHLGTFQFSGISDLWQSVKKIRNADGQCLIYMIFAARNPNYKQLFPLPRGHEHGLWPFITGMKPMYMDSIFLKLEMLNVWDSSVSLPLSLRRVLVLR